MGRELFDKRRKHSKEVVANGDADTERKIIGKALEIETQTTSRKTIISLLKQ